MTRYELYGYSTDNATVEIHDSTATETEALEYRRAILAGNDPAWEGVTGVTIERVDDDDTRTLIIG